MIKGLATTPEVGIQHFNVVCPLGHRVRGQRTEGYQALRCPACGEGVFVLPASPLPDPGPRLSSPSGRRNVESGATSRVVEEGPIELHDPGEVTVEIADALPHPDAEISWEDDAPSRSARTPDGAAEPPADASPSKVARARPAGRPPRPSVRPVEPEPDRDPTPKGSRRREVPQGGVVEVGVRGRRRSGVRPLQVFAIVALLVVGTVVYRVWSTRRQGLPQVAALGRDEGIPALEAGDFDKAYQLLAPAKQAVEALGGEVEGADRIRQAADEASLYVGLAAAGLEELLDEAARTNPKSWASRFDDQHRGRGVLFDSRIRSTPDGPEGRYEIDYVVLPTEDAGSFRAGGSRPERSARIDFRDFELFALAKPQVGDHVVFGARLAAIEFDAGSNAWVVRLEPRSGLFVQFHEALASLGWPEAALSPPTPEPGDEP
ncbi:hypothetical protein [Planctomyces sp. SH-PL62]|uniref:hypothetical protein n=1 Tax=Planctomyces sp. SH-PL62 TaxID=1636152 RepID=UPI00083903C7|nr:hypothetical protein [Planctomyces sp. SH-PL62]